MKHAGEAKNETGKHRNRVLFIGLNISLATLLVMIAERSENLRSIFCHATKYLPSWVMDFL
jgi:hypothetical protein